MNAGKDPRASPTPINENLTEGTLEGFYNGFLVRRMDLMFSVGHRYSKDVQLDDGELPELRLDSVRQRSNAGIAFGGGGMRAFLTKKDLTLS